MLFEAGDPIGTVYFPTSAIVSLVVALSTGEMVEAAMVGRDGVIGAPRHSTDEFRSAAPSCKSRGFICEVNALKGAALQSHTLLAKLIRHEQTVYSQAQQSTACMAAHDVEARLCRWLLRARDLSGSDTLLFTQNFSQKCWESGGRVSPPRRTPFSGPAS